MPDRVMPTVSTCPTLSRSGLQRVLPRLVLRGDRVRVAEDQPPVAILAAVGLYVLRVRLSSCPSTWRVMRSSTTVTARSSQAVVTRRSTLTSVQSRLLEAPMRCVLIAGVSVCSGQCWCWPLELDPGGLPRHRVRSRAAPRPVAIRWSRKRYVGGAPAEGSATSSKPVCNGLLTRAPRRSR